MQVTRNSRTIEITIKPKILLIDDEKHFLESFSELLAEEGLDVIKTTNFLDAIQIIESNPDLRLIITDLSLPMDNFSKPDGKVGLDIIELITSKHSNIPIIVLSAYLERYAKELSALGASAYISKGSPEVFKIVKSYSHKILEDEFAQIEEYLFKKSSKLESIANDIKGTNEYKTIEELKGELKDMLAKEIENYMPIKEKTIYIPEEGQFGLIKPLVGFKKDIENHIAKFPYSKNVFLMMKFRHSNKILSDFIIENLSTHGLNCVRADQDEWNITRNIYNPIAVLYCCKYGIALFDEPEEQQAYSANVAYELGMMHYQNKDCLILRHQTLPIMPFDLIKDLYMSYEKDLQVKQIISSWIKQVSINP